MSDTRHLAIIGAGPIGVETAARFADTDWTIALYEADSIGAHVQQWGHVDLFSSWELNRSRWGRRRLRDAGAELAPDGEYPSGKAYVEKYLLPLAETLSDDVSIYRQTRISGIARRKLLKSEAIGSPRRRDESFLLNVDGPRGARFDEADVVVDATGVLGQPNPVGPGGLSAVGESECDDRILRRIPDVDDRDADLADRRILLVGDGHSAITSLDILCGLRTDAPDTEIIWAYRAAGEPREVIDGDSLPGRARLDHFGNRAARGEVEGIKPLAETSIRRIIDTGDGLDVIVDGPDDVQTVHVDRIVANIGYRPDTSLFRELQVHQCYATEGPMNLAATLIGGDGGDCLDQTSGGIETLESPEPDFWILGAKSYGRNSNFLLKVGFEQIEAVFDAYDLS